LRAPRLHSTFVIRHSSFKAARLANGKLNPRVTRIVKNSWTGGEAATVDVPAAENLALSVHRCQSGAFERLIDQFESALFNYAHGILQNPFDAQEVVQDALMRAHKALTRQYDEARCATLALRPWLFRTVRNLSLNKRRSKKSALNRPLEEFSDDRLGPYVGSADSELVRREDVEMLQRAIALLPVDARELIVLRFMEEMSYAEIAKTIGSTEAALRGKVFRALRLLRDALEKKGVTHAM
jgi:RNA polymerase sigma-70 factor (ECF subfamily)